MRVAAIHDERGYRDIRRALARQYDVAWSSPDIQVADVDLQGDRKLVLQHRAANRVLLDEADCDAVLAHVQALWGYGVVLEEVDPATDKVLRTHAAPGAGAR